MTAVMITQHDQITKLADGSTPVILIIRTYDRKGESPGGIAKGLWMIEALFEGGAKVTGVATAEFVTTLESDLQDQGWQIDASLFHGGFNAKPPVSVDAGAGVSPGGTLRGTSGQAARGLPLGGLKGLWIDDYALPGVPL